MEAFTPEEMLDRMARVRASMHAEPIDAFVSNDPFSIRYLTGFRGEPGRLLLTESEAVLYTSFRSLAWAEAQTTGIELSTEADPVADIAARLSGVKDRTVGVDRGIGHLTLGDLQESLKDFRLQPSTAIDQARRVKSETEIELLRNSQARNEAVFRAVLPQIRAGMTERRVQGLFLSEIASNEELDGYSFSPIVAAGGNAWEIHHRPDATVIREGDMVILDLGVIFQGYASDMTRTICVGEPTESMRTIHGWVAQAQEAAFAAIRSGVSNRAVDAAAREIIEGTGHGRSFTHGLGHSIGLQVHDPGPNLSQQGPDVSLLTGMTFTAEPGIYLENQFGIRTEDTIVVRDDGFENLTHESHDLITL